MKKQIAVLVSALLLGGGAYAQNSCLLYTSDAADD